jgi:hypothetical protein
MTLILKKIFLFILPFILLAYGLDHFLSSTLKKSNSFADGEYPVWNDLYNGEINSDIVIYGSSRALVHIDPGMISDSLLTTAYNLGVNGHSFKSQYFRHKLLMKLNKKPGIIIQTLDVTSFEKSSDLYNPDQYLPYMLNNKEMMLSAYNGFSPVDYKLPVIRYYGKKEAFIEFIKLLVRPAGNSVLRIRGYQGKDLTWNDDLMAAQQKLGSLEVRSDTSMIRLFEDYLNECLRQDIKIVFVNTPVFIEGQRFVSNWAEIMELYYRLSQKYKIPFFDYTNDSISYHKEYFYNSGHLNKTGAELLTAKLINDLRESHIVED